MNVIVKCLVCVLFVVIFCGCSNQYAITYATNPSGAELFCGGAYKGRTPLTLYYDKDGINEYGYLYTQPCEAHFVSGYKAYYDTSYDTDEFPQGVQTTHTRPRGKGYDDDLAFSMEYERQRLLEEQIQLQRQLQQRQFWQQQQQQRQTTTCYQWGNMVQCH